MLFWFILAHVNNWVRKVITHFNCLAEMTSLMSSKAMTLITILLQLACGCDVR